MKRITGSWTPAVNAIWPQQTYTFTPDPGQCATTPTTKTVQVVVIPINTLTTFNRIDPISEGDSFALPNQHDLKLQ